MFGIGFGEFMLIMIVALLVVGPDKLPGIARSVAKAFNELKRTGNELKRTVTGLDVPDPAKVAMGIRNAANSVSEGIKTAAAPAAPAAVAGPAKEEAAAPPEAPTAGAAAEKASQGNSEANNSEARKPSGKRKKAGPAKKDTDSKA